MSAKTILIVDDSQIILKALSMKLRAHGYQVLTAADTATAIGTVRREKPDLIILDVNFPSDSWDGFGLMNWLRRMDEAKHAPVVIISGSDAGNYHQRCIEAGAAGFFLKPLDHEQLLATLRQALGQTAQEQAVVPVPSETADSAQVEEGSDAPKLILMVEDDVALGETLQLFLESKAFRIARFTNGAEALSQVVATDFDIILCDMVMPNLPGQEFYQAVDRVKPHLCNRFIFMTGHHADPRSDGFIRRARAMMLWKPFPLCDLLTAIGIVWKKSRSKPAQPGAGMAAVKIPAPLRFAVK